MSTNVNEDRKRLKDLLTESSDLERELKKLENQKRRPKDAETPAEVEEEAEFLRNSLKDVYEDILLIDFKFAYEYNIEEKLWRTVFYSHIEELRQKLRRIKPEKQSEQQTVYLELCRYLDLGSGFYHTIVNNLKIRENIDLDRIGIEIFKKTNGDNKIASPSSRSMPKFRKKELAAECIQRCLIYLGDFARYREHWDFAKQFYAKAARIHCDNGKAQGQLAVLAAYTNDNLDVVHWYSFSLATKQPSSIAAENLITFYTKFQRSQGNLNDLLQFEEFTRRFLSIHLLLFNEDVEGLKKKAAEIEDLSNNFRLMIFSPPEDNTRKLSIIFKKIIFILIFTIWDYRNKPVQNHTTELRYLQATIVGLCVGFCTAILEHIHQAFEAEGELSLGAASILCLPGAIMWCDYLGSLSDPLLQLYAFARTTEKGGDAVFGQFLADLTNFVRSIIKLLNHPKVSEILSESNDLVELAQRSMPEDLEFLGVIPFRSLHQNLRFGETAPENLLRARMARLFNFAKKFADLKSFEILSFNETSGQFIYIDEIAKKKERQRVMKVMAQQLLQEQVNSLEQNLQKMGLPAQRITPKLTPDSNNSSPKSKPPTKQCVIDISIVLNHLKLVRKWTSDRRCVVIVPLDVIDSLDLIKKGENQENARAREAIRFLDQQFQKIQQVSQQETSKTQDPHRNGQQDFFIRAQKMNEKLSLWSKAEQYLNLQNGTHNNGDIVTEQDSGSNIKFTVMDVPAQYRPVLNCVIYYVWIVKMPDVVLVTDDEECRRFATALGLPVCNPNDI